MKQVLFSLLLLSATASFGQKKLSANELSINGFRSPSMGIEYRYRSLSLHTGYYITAFNGGETTRFIKTGITAWFLPTGKKENPSSFYAGVSYLRGLNRDYKQQNALGVETGYRWMIWKGLNARIGVTGVTAKGHSTKINPASGISYSFFF